MGTGCHEYLLTQITGKKHETSLFGNMGLHWATQLPIGAIIFIQHSGDFE